jgi:hypothetical protein
MGASCTIAVQPCSGAWVLRANKLQASSLTDVGRLDYFTAVEHDEMIDSMRSAGVAAPILHMLQHRF